MGPGEPLRSDAVAEPPDAEGQPALRAEER